MNIDEQTVDKIAHLARLELAADEKQTMIKDMNKILGFMDKLNEVNTTGVEPLVYMTAEVNNLREDAIKQDITTEEALENAPSHDDSHFLVAKVISK
ncbi:Asp-tRNA(Asn)/Glu-tRNA(Gln) amidotransferase subunit GatC [Mucilaginibacter conchicola]|uniref:Aspartyl/glutamyl-tRNA(Asn/Gln) amidotransferase subunit C n=1 Tax=Mucilaginibacter conchicola TaxID=2303333 RepID=A0A372NYN8_9SPHI|nr:Asp-tRNA(Asn)/Glu-tRNA(Gln) amidotransferase subunit GatC [Mucilaginibacter conchicola]RFZ95011.1 Asp-tRNA(Asn)/Glu-tRNA(Gln) amidotransferase subunit GatC [Mucilaginibacter conchicola]